MTNGSLMKVESSAECSKGGAFCNTFDLHQAIIGLENQFLVCLRVAVFSVHSRKFFSGSFSFDSDENKTRPNISPFT